MYFCNILCMFALNFQSQHQPIVFEAATLAPLIVPATPSQPVTSL